MQGVAVRDGCAAALTSNKTVVLCTKGGTPFFALKTPRGPQRQATSVFVPDGGQ